MVYVDPVECIDCLACIVVCPVKAIYTEKDLPESQRPWIEVNATRSRELPLLTLKQEPLPTAQRRRTELGF
jgi:ferredoxin